VLIKNGRIITATDDYYADIYIENEIVTQIGLNLAVEADEVIDAKDRYVIPGGIDSHTHMDIPFGGTVSSDDFDTGTKAAAFGGTTTIVDFAIQTQGESCFKGLDTWHKKADGKATIDYGFHMIVSDMPDSRLGELEKLAEEGVTSYKLFMAYPGVLYVDDGTLYRTFRQAGLNGTRICMHAENGIVIDEIVKAAAADGKLEPKYHALTRPTRMEAEGVHRSIAIAEVAEVPLYIVHLSSSDALEEVKRARARGVDVVAETCPQYLFLDQSLYFKEGFEGAKWVMTPALREKWNQDVLWKGLELGHLCNVATDHCPFCMKDQKELGVGDFRKIPNGAPGVENRLSLMYQGCVVEKRM
jgi:dihydropyrimidinase